MTTLLYVVSGKSSGLAFRAKLNTIMIRGFLLSEMRTGRVLRPIESEMGASGR